MPPLRLCLLWQTAPQSKRDPAKGVYCYYRCIGTDGYRFDDHAVCDNPQIRGDYLEQAVWDRVRALLEDPDRMAGEYHRRLTQTQDRTSSSDNVLQLERQIARLQRGIGRLIDSYAEGVIEPAEFQPRIAGLKTRRARLDEQRRVAVEEAQAERELTLMIGRLEEFATRVSDGLDELDFAGKQALIRTLVHGSRSTATTLKSSSECHLRRLRAQARRNLTRIRKLGTIVRAIVKHRRPFDNWLAGRLKGDRKDAAPDHP